MQINEFLFQLLNGLSGRSWLFDNLLALAATSDLLKAGVIGACLAAAWYGRKTQVELQAARRLILITLAAGACALATTKLVSRAAQTPRPYIFSGRTLQLEDNALTPVRSLAFRPSLDSESQKRYRAFLRGEVPANDWDSFPSDHAGFFLTIALGLWLADRRAGTVAVGWTVLVILAGKIIRGMHTPIDIAAGAAVAAAWLLIMRGLADGRAGRLFDWAAAWSVRHNALGSALLFLAAFEVSSTLGNLQSVLLTGKDIVQHMLRSAGA